MSSAAELLLSKDEGCPSAILRRVSDSQEAHRRVSRRWSCASWWLEFLSFVLSFAGCGLLVSDLLGLHPSQWRVTVYMSLGLNLFSMALRSTRAVLRAEGRAALFRLTTRILSRLWHRLNSDTGMSAEMLSLEAERGMHEVSELVDPTLEIVIVSEKNDELP